MYFRNLFQIKICELKRITIIQTETTFVLKQALGLNLFTGSAKIIYSIILNIYEISS